MDWVEHPVISSDRSGFFELGLADLNWDWLIFCVIGMGCLVTSPQCGVAGLVLSDFFGVGLVVLNIFCGVLKMQRL